MNNITNNDDDVNFSPTFVNYGESYVRMATNRTLFFSEEFSDISCSQLTAMLMYLDSKNNDMITLYINSIGGVISGLFSILEAINLISSPVRTICIGSASSCGAVLLSAGAKGERYATSTSEVMIHEVSGGVNYTCDFAKSSMYMRNMNDHNDNILKVLAKNCGHSLKKVKKDCLIDTYFTAKESKKYGLIDHII